MRKDAHSRPSVACAVAGVCLAGALSLGEPAAATPAFPDHATRFAAPALHRADESGARIQLAQQSGGFSVQDIAGPAGKPLPVLVSLPPENGDLFRVLMFRGMPEDVTLNHGVEIGEGYAVSPDQLDGLALVTPEDFSGQFQFDVVYVHGTGDNRERRTVLVQIDGPTASTRPQVSEQEIEDMLARSRKLLKTGDIAGARLMLDYIARRDSPRGAFALAQTYDPQFLESLGVRGGVKPNIAKALQWYRKAARLGSEPASTRLSALEAGQ